MIIRKAASLAQFAAAKMGKVSVASGEHIYAGLNCFEPGQEHKAHIHADQDKLYVILEGAGEASVGGESQPVEPGDVILARAGILHGMRNTGTGRLVVLVVFSPPPKPAGGGS